MAIHKQTESQIQDSLELRNACLIFELYLSKEILKTSSIRSLGWVMLVVAYRTREYRRNWFQVDFEKLEIDFTIFVCFDRCIYGKKAKLLQDSGNELANGNQL
ncbi:Hypothetical_protein [Hexamita inflata]|uniref:Hypothetical_protein n=1 Tax=Hexamita inflata TaxID=28002 RepID=A0AA86Q9H9_9EUKA|nr:Hypothetical protein HINF_LOCUS36369 [Hexamita inflata]